MRSRFGRSLGWGLLGLGALALAGCYHGYGGYAHERVVVVDGDHHGPPAHAPAHGYRRKHAPYHHTHRHKQPRYEPQVAVELVFDDSLGVHVVVGHAGVYFHADHYYRLGDAGWEWTARLGQSWVAAPDHGVPTGLRKLHHRGKGHKAKRRHSQALPPQHQAAAAKASVPSKASPPRKARFHAEREDPSPPHRHRHDEQGRGWN